MMTALSDALTVFMSTNSNFEELPGLSVTLDRLVYRDANDISPERPHCFAYFLTIRNQSQQTVVIKARKWVIRNQNGITTVVEGEGVVGQTPTLEPGEDFSYNSQHFIDTPRATAEGSYLGLNPQKQKVIVRIPRFEMVVPQPE